MGDVFLTAEWRDIVMLNYEVAPELLKDRVPAGTELDLFEGKALASVVGFQFLETRVRGFSFPWHRHFDEINLRFYVRSSAEPVRRGVVFIKEIVPRRAIAWVARTLYNENYHAHPMRHAFTETVDARTLSYELEAGGRRHALRATTEGSLHPLVAGTEEEFIAEHYYGYARQRDGGTLEYRVEHPPWQVHAARDAELDFDVAAVYGEEFETPLRGAPRSALIAEGSAVMVAKPVRVEVVGAPALAAIGPA